MTEHRTVLHADLNAFFASVEQQANPALRGKPIAVVGGSGRTVITTSSYEARSFGVRTGMAVWEAKRVCPAGNYNCRRGQSQISVHAQYREKEAHFCTVITVVNLL